MPDPSVQVKELAPQDIGRVAAGDAQVDLGDARASAALSRILTTARRAPGTRAFVLSWRGGKIPRGARVAGHAIGWTQHNIVRTQGGASIGSYDRLIENGGPEGDQQQMLVFIRP